MSTRLNPKLDYEDLESTDTRHRRGAKKPLVTWNKRSQHAVRAEILEYAGTAQLKDEQAFNPSLAAKKHELEWILAFLGGFYDEQMITDVLAKVKGGKEANVYCCAAFPGLGVELLAAKIYRPRMFRQLRNDILYREGRPVIDEYGKQVKEKERLAVQKGSAFGKQLSHASWLQHEYETLVRLSQAGLDVPRPHACANNTILMEYLGEAFNAAPSLKEIRLSSRREAQQLFERLIDNVERMLALDLIHGDLSAYNVLYWDGEVRIIDFPQAIDPQENRNAYAIFKRDVTRLCDYFRTYGIKAQGSPLAWKLWQQRGFAALWKPDDTDWEDKGD